MGLPTVENATSTNFLSETIEVSDHKDDKKKSKHVESLSAFEFFKLVGTYVCLEGILCCAFTVEECTKASRVGAETLKTVAKNCPPKSLPHKSHDI